MVVLLRWYCGQDGDFHSQGDQLCEAMVKGRRS